jgi:hypothetical protein
MEMSIRPITERCLKMQHLPINLSMLKVSKQSINK